MTNTRPPRPDPVQPRPRPSDERAKLAQDGRTTRTIAVLALVLALVGTALAVARFVLPAGEATTASCQKAAWDVRPAAADLPEGYVLSAVQYDINRQQTTLLGPIPADENAAQGVVYVTVTCFADGAADAVARSEQAARDASQTVTTRDDLGDGGFAAVDETGATFLQLRHGDVVVYLAASSDVAGGDVDALASAYDKAMGGDGGAAAVGTPDAGGPSQEPAASDVAPSEGAPSAAAAPDLEALLPTQVNDITLTVDSAIGSDFLVDDSARAIVAELRSLGKEPSDLRFAQAYDDSQTADLGIQAIAVDGLPQAKLRTLVQDFWLSASGSGVTEKSLEWSGRKVTRLDYGDGGSKYYLVPEGDTLIVVTTADEALAEATVKALPKAP